MTRDEVRPSLRQSAPRLPSLARAHPVMNWSRMRRFSRGNHPVLDTINGLHHQYATQPQGSPSGRP